MSMSSSCNAGPYDPSTFIRILADEIAWLRSHCPALTDRERLTLGLREACQVDDRLRLTNGRYIIPANSSANDFVGMRRGPVPFRRVAKKLAAVTA